MKIRAILFIMACWMALFTYAQPPKLYINIVSHNEPGDSLHTQAKFNRAKVLVPEFADLVKLKGARWNLGTCDGFVESVLNFQMGGTTSGDLLETITGSSYNGSVEIDPRNKNNFGRNVADLYYLLDSCGARPSRNLSGFIYASTTPTRPDWFQYKDTIYGDVYPAAWKADVIWGAGSLLPHTNDLNDYGIWKPDTINNFYQHNPNRNLWYQGNGCQPVLALDSLEDAQIVIAQIKGAVDSIQRGLWPPDKFYCYSVTINQSQFGPMLFAKMSAIMDSVHDIGDTKIEWATITEKHRKFLTWAGTSASGYSQWNCGMAPVAAPEPSESLASLAYPNPFHDILHFQFADGKTHSVTIYNVWGQACLRADVRGDAALGCEHLPAGIYLAVVDGRDRIKLVRE